ncbi:MAG: DUF3341 domain-containing protein [Acidobacteriota bacterium]
MAQPESIYGAVGEFASPRQLLAAIQGAKERGYRKLDAFTPFAAHGIDEALDRRRSPLGYIVFAMGALGAAAALVLQWWTGAVDYPLVIAGKPLFALEFSLPIIFELTVLFAAFGAVLGMFALNGLPRLYHPIFKYSRYQGVTNDAFLLAIEADSKDFDAEQAADTLKSLGGKYVEVIAG